MKNLAINSNSSALNGIVTIIFHSQGFFVFSIFHLKRSTDNEIVQKMRDNIQIWFIGNHILVKALIVSLSRHLICYTRSTCCLAIVCIECSVGFIGSIVPYHVYCNADSIRAMRLHLFVIKRRCTVHTQCISYVLVLIIQSNHMWNGFCADATSHVNLHWMISKFFRRCLYRRNCCRCLDKNSWLPRLRWQFPLSSSKESDWIEFFEDMSINCVPL